MTNPPNPEALAQRLAQLLALLQQQAHDPAGGPAAANAKAKLEGLLATLAAQGVTVNSHGGVSLGDGTNIGVIEKLIGGDHNTYNININELHLPPATAPAPTPAPGVLHEVEAPVADFIGREDELDELVKALTSGAANGAVISGVQGLGGIGKTQLARKVVAEVGAHFPDGVLLVDLFGSRSKQSRAGSPTPLTPEQALRVVLQPFLAPDKLDAALPELRKQFQNTMRNRRVLILADDAGSRAQVEPLVPPPGSALLITSRVSFTLPGMFKRELKGLPPEQAVELLRRICPRIGVREAEQIARLCGYLPLALRISATLLLNNDDRPVAHYNAEGALDGGYLFDLSQERTRLEALRDPEEERESLPEQRNLDVEASLLLSYQQLAPDEQAAFRTLGVFAAPFDARAAEAVMAEPGQAANPEWLRRLRRYHLLEYSTETERYSLHELVRVFALARLAEAGPEVEQAAQERHAGQYIAVAVKAEQLFLRGDGGMMTGLTIFNHELIADVESLARLDNLLKYKHNGIEAPTRYIAHMRHAQYYIRLVGMLSDQYTAKETDIYTALRVFDLERGQLNLIEQRIYQQIYSAPNSEVATLVIAHIDATTHLSDLRYQKQIERIPQLKSALSAARHLQNRIAQGRLLGNLGLAYWALGDPFQAAKFYEQSLVIARELGDRQSESNTLCNLGNIYLMLGEPRRAITFYEQSFKIAEEIGDLRSKANALGNLGNAYFTLGKTKKAISLYQDLIEIFRALDDLRSEINTLGNINLAYLKTENLGRVIETSTQRIAISRNIGDRRSEANSLSHLGNAYFDLGDYNQAVISYQESLYIAQQLGDEQVTADVSWNLGLSYIQANELLLALSFLQQGLSFYEKINHPRATIMAEIILCVREHGILPNFQKIPVIPEDLPEEIRIALENQDEHALQQAFNKLQPAQRTEAEQMLVQFATDVKVNDPESSANPATSNLDLDDTVRLFLPVLCDIALATYGNTDARNLVEAALPLMEQKGLRITKVVHQIWMGERNMAVLTTGLNDQEGALVNWVLALVADGPDMIFAAHSLQIAHLRRCADADTAEALRNSDLSSRRALAQRLTDLAQQAEKFYGVPWQTIAAHLRVLAGRLMSADSADGEQI